MPQTVIAFDLYGTLHIHGVDRLELHEPCGNEKTKTIATGKAVPTRVHLAQAAAEAGVGSSKDQEERIMGAYNGPSAFSEVGDALKGAKDSLSLDLYIFSSGTYEMITSSLTTPRDLSKATNLLPPIKVISVDTLRFYKPDPRTYEHLTQKVGLQEKREKVWLVSSNPFGVLGAVAAGSSAVWADRAGADWIDGLAGVCERTPKVIAKGVDEAVRTIKKLGDAELR